MKLQDIQKEKNIPAILADREGFITYVNKPFVDTFGWEEKEIIGKPLTVIIPKNLHDAHHMGFSRFLMTEKPTLLEKPLKLLAVKKSGEEFNSEHVIIAEQTEGEWVFGATIRPLNDPKK